MSTVQAGSLDKVGDINTAWKAGLEFVRKDDDFLEENEGLFKLSKPQEPEQAQERIRQILDSYEQDSRLSKCMKCVRPLVEGLQFVSSLGSSVAAFDPHGVAPIAWAAGQVVLSGINRYYEAFDKIDDFVQGMNDEIARLRKWAAPAASNLFARSLHEVFRKYAQFCIALSALLKAKSSGKVWKRSGRVVHLIEEVCLQCNNATKNAEAATADNFSVAMTNQSNDLCALRRDAKDIRSDMAEVRNGVYYIKENITDLRDASRLQQHRDFLGWVGFYDTSGHLETASNERLPGTGAWIYEEGDEHDNAAMKKWLSSGHPDYNILWMTADPGFGKDLLDRSNRQRVSTIRSSRRGIFFL